MALDPNAAPGGGAFAGLGADTGAAGLGAVDPAAAAPGMAAPGMAGPGPGGEAPPPEVQAAMEAVMPIFAEATPRIVMAVFEALAGIAGTVQQGGPGVGADPMAAVPPATGAPLAGAPPEVQRG